MICRRLWNTHMQGESHTESGDDRVWSSSICSLSPSPTLHSSGSKFHQRLFAIRCTERRSLSLSFSHISCRVTRHGFKGHTAAGRNGRHTLTKARAETVSYVQCMTFL
ncbi:hypothetical protein KP509_09G090500 [Ceratopteris richardii]|uniref:Uncharacterized protein n=1 Tax=Ceratopteris richardii TaxID=49495 RepID=A0A8T2UA89_CERRI|nr:hypothetical protein KP509_09G090500 [Ceratopteris richardii]